MSDVDLSWMNTPGPDGLTWAQKNAGASPDLSWMNTPGPDGLTWAQKQRKIASGATAGTTEEKNALAYLENLFKQFNLSSLTNKAWEYIIQNGVQDETRMLLWMREQPEFKKRFPAYEVLQQKYRNIQPAEYVMLERQYAQVMRSAGLSANFFDHPDDFTALIENDVSQAEFQERIENGFKKVSQADPKVREAFQRYFGVEGDAALAAFFIDPERSSPKLSKAAQMAELGGTASATGVNLSSEYAEKLTRLGVSQQQALSGFQKMQQQRGLFERSIGETEVVSPAASFETVFDGTGNVVRSGEESGMSTTEAAGIDYVFGTDVEVQRDLERRLNQRRAQASGVTQQNVVDRQGKTSLGVAD